MSFRVLLLFSSTASYMVDFYSFDFLISLLQREMSAVCVGDESANANIRCEYLDDGLRVALHIKYTKTGYNPRWLPMKTIFFFLISFFFLHDILLLFFFKF